MNKKKIIILMKTMNIGGAERSLLGLLNALDYDKYDVSLKLFHHTGAFMKYIPKQVNLIPEDPRYSVFEVSIKSLLFSRYLMFGLARILSKIELLLYCKINGVKKGSWIKQQYTNKYVAPLLPEIRGKFDLAINFLGVPDILINKVKAKVKVGWVHTDYDQLSVNKKRDSSLYSKLNYIVNVSEDCNRVFVKHYPHLIEKSIVIENILSKKLIQSQANQFLQQSDLLVKECNTTILSIGRFGNAKNFDNIPEIASNIMKNGLKVLWYIIGYGNDEELIKRKIIEYDMQKNVILLGRKENPYPYIKACELYIQPSRYEGKSVTVREAQILCKPVVITNYETASSQLNDLVNGVIVPMDNDGCANGISDFIKNINLQKIIIRNCAAQSFDNEAEIEKIYSFIQ